MSFRRYFEWTCDTCGATATTVQKLPPGWAWYVPHMGPTTHVCEKCPIPEDVPKALQERTQAI